MAVARMSGKVRSSKKCQRVLAHPFYARAALSTAWPPQWEYDRKTTQRCRGTSNRVYFDGPQEARCQ